MADRIQAASLLRRAAAEIAALPGPVLRGHVAAAAGMTIEAGGLGRRIALADRCTVLAGGGGAPEREIRCEVIGFREGRTVLMAMDDPAGVAPGHPVELRRADALIRPSPAWLGRVVNGLGEPIDGRGPIPAGDAPRPLRGKPPLATARRRLGPRVGTGVRAIDAFTPLCRGQRMGIFAAAGVGKSTLLSMLARGAEADAIVIGLVGERGREVNEFIEEGLGPEGLARSVVVVATSDESALLRRDAAHLAMTVAEDLRDRGLDVLLLMDSLTRYATALREIGLLAGEPPTTRGYPPSVFGELPRLLERAGTGGGLQGDITALFTVLVEGDDHDEPVSDTVRGILDGHIVLSRRIAQAGRFPAIDVLRSLSRAVDRALTPEALALSARARQLLAVHEGVAEMIRIGAYVAGSDPDVDEAIRILPALERFLAQEREDRTPPGEGQDRLAGALAGEGPA
ncbi:FliI/YscN family ATPase [Inquilinus limosus]|uniref:FliI/YscN family ATPase n=1 Tax=Inquilinus limosus TaxID=171674 RepID=UPI0003F9BF2D|nr:FliI/YscN family ATPase [Inquilinus limosus]